MRIGIDIDNTIIDYNASFLKNFSNIHLSKKKVFQVPINQNVTTKKQIKRYIHREIGEEKWQKLQTQVYGEGIKYAKIFPEFLNFLLLAINYNTEIFLVSHKTKYAHNNKKVLLRNKCISFLRKKNIISTRLLDIKNIYFCGTREEKISKINSLKCDYFIDDLKEVLKDKAFPKNTIKILFNDFTKDKNIESFNSWRSIKNFIFPKNINLEIKLISSYLLKEKINIVTKIKSKGKNSEIFKIYNKNKSYCLKLYPDLSFDNRNRLSNESINITNLLKNGIKQVPKINISSSDLNCTIFEWFEKDKDQIIPNKKNLSIILQFLKKINSKNSNLKKHSPTASAACFNGIDIQNQIERRYNTIYQDNIKNKK